MTQKSWSYLSLHYFFFFFFTSSLRWLVCGSSWLYYSIQLFEYQSSCCWKGIFWLLLFSHLVVSDSLRPHGLKHARLSCPSLSPGACSNPCPLSRWCHPTISSCRPLFLLPSIFPSIRVFSNESALWKRRPKYCSFSINPSNDYSMLISFRIDWLDLFAVQRTLKSLLQHHSSKFF